jgi:hypothetical protein
MRRGWGGLFRAHTYARARDLRTNINAEAKVERYAAPLNWDAALRWI